MVWQKGHRGKARNRNLRYLSPTGPVSAQIVYVYPSMVVHVYFFTRTCIRIITMRWKIASALYCLLLKLITSGIICQGTLLGLKKSALVSMCYFLLVFLVRRCRQKRKSIAIQKSNKSNLGCFGSHNLMSVLILSIPHSWPWSKCIFFYLSTDSKQASVVLWRLKTNTKRCLT